jgi:heme/copper-type cytochrome/quinol oxidase subunit 3
MSSSNPTPLRSRAASGFSLSIGQLGMLIVLVSISVLFIATVVALLVTRAQAPAPTVASVHELPWGVAASTLFLGALSWVLQRSLSAIRSNRFEQCQRALTGGGALALAFLVGQAFNANRVLASEAGLEPHSLFLVSFFVLIGVHALHVVGGLVPLALVYVKVIRREYSSSRHEGLKLCVQYWHYLGVVWMFLLLVIAGLS